jgi:ketosteroid isomerase-like protein
VREIICQGTSAAIEWHWTERSRQSRQVSEADDVIVVRCRDGKIAYWREYIDGPCRRLRR